MCTVYWVSHLNHFYRQIQNTFWFAHWNSLMLNEFYLLCAWGEPLPVCGMDSKGFAKISKLTKILLTLNKSYVMTPAG